MALVGAGAKVDTCVSFVHCFREFHAKRVSYLTKKTHFAKFRALLNWLLACKNQFRIYRLECERLWLPCSLLKKVSVFTSSGNATLVRTKMERKINIYIYRYPGKPYPSFNRKGLTNVYTGVANHQLQILEGCLLHASHGETDLMNVHVGVANPQLQILEGCLLHASRGEGTQPAETLNSLVSTRHLVCRRSS